MKKIIILGVAHILVLAACLLPDGASAQSFILDSGTPTSGTYPILSSSEWFAGEFSATAGETITQLSAYLTSQSGNGDNFTFDLYLNNASGLNFVGTRNAQLSPDGFLALSTAGTYTAPGWSSASVNWVVPTTGNYWLAIEQTVTSGRNLPTFDAQEETSAGTGTAPALAFAFAFDTGIAFATASAPPIGLEVTVAVPEPATCGLIGSTGVAALSVWTARRRKISPAI